MLANTLAENKDTSLDGTKVTRHVGGVGAEEYTAVDILSKHGLGTKTGRGNGIELSMDTADSGKFLEQYEELLAAKEEIEAKLDPKDLSESDTYREISEMIDATETEYEKLKEMQAEADKYGVVNITEGFKKDEKTFESTGEAMDSTNINSLEEYMEYRNAILNDSSLEGDEVAKQAALDWLEAQGHLTEYEEARAKMSSAADIVGKTVKESGAPSDLGANKKEIEANLQSFYNDLSSSD